MHARPVQIASVKPDRAQLADPQSKQVPEGMGAASGNPLISLNTWKLFVQISEIEHPRSALSRTWWS